MTRELSQLWQRGCEFLGTKYAIMGGAMTWVSERHLVSAISNGGGFGILASGSMPPALLAAEISATRAMTDKPFGVNLITMHPQLDELIEICLSLNMSHVVLAGGVPTTPTIEKLKEAGTKVICFAPTLALAKRMAKAGADALVIEGMEAGGHVGAVSTGVLAQEILPALREVPVFVAGGIGRGEAILAYLEMGAAGCQLGTRFVAAYECRAHPEFKKAYMRSSARDAVLSVQLDPRFPVIPVRALRNHATEAFLETQREVIEAFNQGRLTQEEASLKIEHFWAGALRRAVVDGDIRQGSLMAGQSVGMVKKEQSAQEILEELYEQALNMLKQRQK